MLSLSLLLVNPRLDSHPTLPNLLFDTISLLSDFLALETRLHCIQLLRDQHHIYDARLRFVLGYENQEDSDSLRLVTDGPNASHSEQENASVRSVPFPLRRWEMVQDATPIFGENDTSLSLSLFEAKKAIL